MHPNDGTRIWPKPPDLEMGNDGVSLVYNQDSNLITVSKEVFVYAFFDSLERDRTGCKYAPFDQRNVVCNDPQELWTARFDCVRMEYFNDNIGALREFYSEARGEDLDGEEQDLRKAYWHDSDRTERHAKLLLELFTQDHFRTLFYIANRTDESDAFFRDVLRGERWIGLGLTKAANPPLVTLFHYDDELLEAPDVWQVTSLYELTQRRINSLRHVFSLDFVSDAWFPPPPPRSTGGTPVDSGPLTMGERMAQQKRKKKGEEENRFSLKKQNLKKRKTQSQRDLRMLALQLYTQQVEVR